MRGGSPKRYSKLGELWYAKALRWESCARVCGTIKRLILLARSKKDTENYVDRVENREVGRMCRAL